jgi:stage II sporulation protein D
VLQRLLLFALALATACVVLPATSPAAPTSTQAAFLLDGRGWGHGVGLSQWGALGQAKAGRSYRQILAHYYRGTKLGPAPVGSVRVLLADGAERVRISSTGRFRVRDARGQVLVLPAGRLVVRPGLRIRTAAGVRRLEAPLRFRPGPVAPLELGGVAYRGELRVAVEQGRLRAVNVVGLQPYLMGVVAAEMPFDWPAEALKAQAVAARSYALARRERGKPFDLYPDWRSQVYGGVAAETPETTRAVLATAGEVLLYGDRVATALFHSTSGGRTAAVQDVYGAGFEAPYLVSVSDPWDASSPYHRWEARTLTPARLGRALALRGPASDVVVERASSGRVTTVRARAAGGPWREVTGAEMRDRLGLRSTWFRLGVLRLSAEAPRVPAGRPLELSGVARDVSPVELQVLEDGVWTTLRRVRADADGTFAVVLRPERTGAYRLAAGTFASEPLTVRVAVASR